MTFFCDFFKKNFMKIKSIFFQSLNFLTFSSWEAVRVNSVVAKLAFN